MTLTTNEVGTYNRLSPETRKKVEEKISSFNGRVRYKFNIGYDNPDPEKYNGKIIYPNTYTLDPCRLQIVDTAETRAGETKQKLFALVDADSVNDKGNPERVGKMRVYGRQGGVVELNTSEPGSEDWHKAFYIEMHSKLKDGIFQSKELIPIIERIDEVGDAQIRTERRNLKRDALNAAAGAVLYAK